MQNKISNSDGEFLKEKIHHLEDKYKTINQMFKHVLTAITIIFIFVGVIITVLSITSKNEVTNAIDKMERKFEILSGQYIKESKIDFYYNDILSTQKTTKIISDTNNSIKISKIYIKNNGTKIAKNIVIKLFSTHIFVNISSIQIEGFENSKVIKSWVNEVSHYEGYPGLVRFEENISLNPGETYSFESIETSLYSKQTYFSPIHCFFAIFSEENKPVEVQFDIFLTGK